MADIGRVSIILFKAAGCAPCKIVEKNLRSIISTASLTNVSLTTIDTEEEQELKEKYKVTSVPMVLYNDKPVLTAQMAAELLGNELGMMVVPKSKSNDEIPLSPFGSNLSNFEIQKPQNTSQDADNPLSTLNFDTNGDIFSNGQNAVFNHLFNSLIEASVEASKEELARWQKFNMLTISQKTMTIESIQTLTRPSVGDYVHIGVLQSIVTSILAINPASRQYLYEVGENMGRYGNVQFRFLSANTRILEKTDTAGKFRDLLEGLQDLYSANSLGLPLFLTSRSLVESNNKNKAKILVYDSAYSAQMAPIGQPVCYLIAGEIAGLIETTLGEEHVSVQETKCWGLGDTYCQFDIEIGKQMNFKLQKERAFLTDVERTRFQNSLNTISKNMYNSSLIRTILRPNPGDYVHISVLQQALNGIKFSDPFFSSLLFYAGIHYGRYGADFTIIERIMKKHGYEPPLEFEQACSVLHKYFSDPSTILTRMYGEVESIVEDDQTAIFRIYESAISSGLNFEVEGKLMFEVDRTRAVLCDYTAGFIQGRLQRLIEDDIQVKETTCYSLGTPYCEFLIEID